MLPGFVDEVVVSLANLDEFFALPHIAFAVLVPECAAIVGEILFLIFVIVGLPFWAFGLEDLLT